MEINNKPKYRFGDLTAILIHSKGLNERINQSVINYNLKKQKDAKITSCTVI